jgi:hypothetical protein
MGGVEAARKKREKSHDVDRSDLGAVSEGKDSQEGLDNETRAQLRRRIVGEAGAYKESI